jgi:hypothetical protein
MKERKNERKKERKNERTKERKNERMKERNEQKDPNQNAKEYTTEQFLSILNPETRFFLKYLLLT